jgi:hypothetical protein
LEACTPLLPELFHLVLNCIHGPCRYNPVKAGCYWRIMKETLEAEVESWWIECWKSLQDDAHAGVLLFAERIHSSEAEAIEAIHKGVIDEVEENIYNDEGGHDIRVLIVLDYKDLLDRDFASEADAVLAAKDLWENESYSHGESVRGLVFHCLNTWVCTGSFH